MVAGDDVHVYATGSCELQIEVVVDEFTYVHGARLREEDGEGMESKGGMKLSGLVPMAGMRCRSGKSLVDCDDDTSLMFCKMSSVLVPMVLTLIFLEFSVFLRPSGQLSWEQKMSQ